MGIVWCLINELALFLTNSISLLPQSRFHDGKTEATTASCEKNQLRDMIPASVRLRLSFLLSGT